MSEVETIGSVVVALMSITSLICTITVPLIKLNNNITMLTEQIDHMHENDMTRDKRLQAHGQKLDEHDKILAEHSIRIEHIEKDLNDCL